MRAKHHEGSHPSTPCHNQLDGIDPWPRPAHLLCPRNSELRLRAQWIPGSSVTATENCALRVWVLGDRLTTGGNGFREVKLRGQAARATGEMGPSI